MQFYFNRFGKFVDSKRGNKFQRKISFYFNTTTLLQSWTYLIKIWPIDALVIAVVEKYSVCNRYILRILLKILISTDL